MIKLWSMPSDDCVKSQFEQNYEGEIDVQKFCEKTGVQYNHFDPNGIENNEKFNELRRLSGYNYEDRVIVSPEKLGPEYHNKLKIFYTEHLHTDDEVRFVLDGSGYFDIRGADDDWVRIWTRKGDMIVIPAGSYHRFTTDENHYIHALRLFIGDPIWTPYNRPCDDIECRLEYLKKFHIKF